MDLEKELDKIIDVEFYPEEDYEDENRASLCWGIKIDREHNKIFFSIDSKEILSCSLAKVTGPLNRAKLNSLLKVLRTGDSKAIRKAL
jgi:hypothetical protein